MLTNPTSIPNPPELDIYKARLIGQFLLIALILEIIQNGRVKKWKKNG